MSSVEYEKLMTPGEVSALFRVSPVTVSRWAKAGKLEAIRTPGGHRRFREADIRALLADCPPPPQPDPLDAAAGSLWPAGAVRNRIQAAGIATVRDLTALAARDLADIGLRPGQVDEVRLALHKRGLALYGEIADTAAA